MSRRSRRLVARLRHAHRSSPAPDVAAALRSGPDRAPGTDLPARVAHLEQLVQGLQDSVYRESRRQEKRIAELEAQIEPAALAAAISKHARERGL